jgi:DNA-binding transcriptional LysR family regulator
MEIYQLKTFVAVAREGSITRASERLYLSQPAISAHIKAMEDTLGITLFERTVRGMSLTSHGQHILAKAEMTLRTHCELIEKAKQIKGDLTGKLRISVGSGASKEIVSRLLMVLFDRYPDVAVSLQHANSRDALAGIRNGDVDSGFYDEADESAPDLTTIEASRFDIYLVAPPVFVESARTLRGETLSELRWIISTACHCCGKAAESLFKAHNFRPKRIISVDCESVARTLLAKGIGIALLHAHAARDAQQRGEAEIICEARKAVRVLFAHLAHREHDPLLRAVSAIVSAGSDC